MSTAYLLQGEQSAKADDTLGTDDLDFMTISLQHGQLRIGGSLMKSSIQTGRLKKLILDASEQLAMISFQGIDVPVEINTFHHGKLYIKPNAGVVILPLLAPFDVLKALGLTGGLAVKPTFNVEAVFGFLHELRVEEGLLFSSAGHQLLPSQCHALLCRLGAESTSRADNKACLKACVKLGIKGVDSGGFLAGLLNWFGGSSKRLTTCVRVLEERGYWIRLRGRVSSVCHPLPEETDVPRESLRLFAFKQAHEFPLAA